VGSQSWLPAADWQPACRDANVFSNRLGLSTVQPAFGSLRAATVHRARDVPGRDRSVAHVRSPLQFARSATVGPIRDTHRAGTDPATAATAISGAPQQRQQSAKSRQ
jgi:hypothetical protein